MTALRILLRAAGVTLLLFCGAAFGWMLLGIVFPVNIPPAPTLLFAWVITMGVVAMIEVLCSFGEDRGRDR